MARDAAMAMQPFAQQQAMEMMGANAAGLAQGQKPANLGSAVMQDPASGLNNGECDTVKLSLSSSPKFIFNAVYRDQC